jgi:DNA-binding CsgD family transcriptional regulator
MRPGWAPGHSGDTGLTLATQVQGKPCTHPAAPTGANWHDLIVSHPNPPTRESVVVLGAVSLTAILVALGATHGLWMSNLHNGLLAIIFSSVGALVLSRRPGHPEARLFLLVGAAEAVLFAGRQVGLDSDRAADAWWGWLGVWPTALTIGLTTWVVMSFPEGRFLSARWRSVTLVGIGLATATALMSAMWPVEYPRSGVGTPFPFELPGPALTTDTWRAVAYPTYAGLQLLWLAGLAARWRASDSVVRRQLMWLLAAVALTLVLMFGGLLLGHGPTAGKLAVAVVPLVAGWLLERLSLARVVEAERASGRLDELSPRENDVLDLMAQGLSNTAIAGRLHLSIKTVEPAISSIFRKLGLHDDPASNRRVLAVAEYWRRQQP